MPRSLQKSLLAIFKTMRFAAEVLHFSLLGSSRSSQNRSQNRPRKILHPKSIFFTHPLGTLVIHKGQKRRPSRLICMFILKMCFSPRRERLLGFKGDHRVPKMDSKSTKNGSQMDPKIDPILKGITGFLKYLKWTQNRLKMDPKWIPKWTRGGSQLRGTV